MSTLLRQALRFAAVGLCNTSVGLAVIYGAMFLLDATPALANAIGYCVGLAVGFALNRSWTFGSRERVAIVLPKYLLAVALAYALNLMVVLAAISRLHANPYLAQLLGIAVYTVSLFLAARTVVFQRGKLA